MISFKTFLEAEESKNAPYLDALTSVLNIDPRFVRGEMINSSSPVFAQAIAKTVFGIDQIGSAEISLDAKPGGKMYRVKLVNKNPANMLYKDGRKVNEIELNGDIDEDTLNKIFTQGLAGWNNSAQGSTSSQPGAQATVMA